MSSEFTKKLVETPLLEIQEFVLKYHGFERDHSFEDFVRFVRHYRGCTTIFSTGQHEKPEQYRIAVYFDGRLFEEKFFSGFDDVVREAQCRSPRLTPHLSPYPNYD